MDWPLSTGHCLSAVGMFEMLAFRKTLICIAAVALLALVLRVSIGAGTDEGGATSHAVSVNAVGNENASIPDFDGDGTIGFGDLLIFAEAFGSSRGDDDYNATYDLNGDGNIGFADLLIFAENFGKKAEVSYDDRSALVAFYHATDGPNWKNSENWLTDAPLGDWFGVDTDGEGRVVRLAMSYYDYQTKQWISNNVSGPLPAELGNLTSLEHVQFFNNSLSGPIPPELGKLANLTYLDFNGNDLSGPIPPELGGLSKLTSLNLHNNDLSGPIPPELGGLSNLTLLWLGDNDLSSPIPSELGNLPNLEWLWLQNNELTGTIPQSFLQLDGLRVFSVRDNEGLCVPGTSNFVGWLRGIEKWEEWQSLCNAADVAALKSLYESAGGSGWTESSGWLGDGAVEAWRGVSADSLGRVTVLDLSDNGLSGTLPRAIVNLERLAGLRIDGNPRLSGRLPLGLASLPLLSLRYSGTGVCAPGYAFFRDWLSALPLHWGTGIQCAPLTDREVLEAVYEAMGGAGWTTTDNWLSDRPFGEWHGVETDGRGRVTDLFLDLNNLSGRIPPELGSLTQLRELSIGGFSRIAGVIPPELGNLANLRFLQIFSTDVSGPIPAELGRLANLESLILWGNDLTGPIPPELGNLARLRELDVNDNQLEGEIPAELGGLANLDRLSLSANELAGPLPVELGNLTALTELSVSRNRLTGRLPGSLGGLANLERLHAGHNDLEGPVPDAFGGLTRLRELSLSGNAAMAGPLPAGLAGLDALGLLLADATGLCAPTDAGFLEWLGRLPASRVALCGSGPAAAYLVQAVQSREFPVPLVAGEKALLRVFPTATRANGEGIPAIRVRFFVNGRETHVENVPGKSDPIPSRVDESSLSTSANAVIPGRVIRPGLEMVVEVDPEGTLDPGLGVARRIPETGRLPVDVREMPVFNLTVIPYLWSEDPDTAVLRITAEMAADPHGHELLRETRTLLPVGDIEVTRHEPVSIVGNYGPSLIGETDAIRTLEGGGGHWMGLMSGSFTGPGGQGHTPGRISYAIPPSVSTISHELGHNMNLRHAPCADDWDPDPAFPYPDGSIGAWGYDFDRQRLVDPSTTKDRMSYCGPGWISDYHFTKALHFRLEDEDAPAAAPASVRALLLWGGADADGVPYLEPAFAVAARPLTPESHGEYRIAGRSAEGAQLLSFSFAMPEPCDAVGGASFAFALPIEPGWEALASVTLSGPEGAATLDGDSDAPMAILRDPRNGHVRAFLRDLPRSAVAQAAAKIAAGAQGLEVLFSRGIPDNLIPEPDDADERR